MQVRQILGPWVILFILAAFFFIVPFVSPGTAQEEPSLLDEGIWQEEEPPVEEEKTVEEENPPEPKKRRSHLHDEERQEDDNWFRDGYDYGILKDSKNGIGQEWRTESGTYSDEWEGGRAEGDLFYDFNNEPSSDPLPEIETEQPETPKKEKEKERADSEDKLSTEPSEGPSAQDGQAPL